MVVKPFPKNEVVFEIRVPCILLNRFSLLSLLNTRYISIIQVEGFSDFSLGFHLIDL